ncbi:S-layer homology domain-containing protein [Bacillus cereus]|uniref:S-layer homology domain-containing protein n=1 Tax=Bacillus cereus TaxID=1396 RepID=UPI00227DC530|nr:S-layer homology domain-containing protein [Bacillus cereus]
MAQQKPSKSNDDVFKRKLFYDNGIRFVQVRGRMTGDYKPPTPVLKSHINENIQSSAGLVGKGTSHYSTTIQFLFASKEEFADWLQFIGAEHKYYDEKGTIYLGIVNSDLDIKTAEFETKYIITVNLMLIRKQDFEYRHQYPFIDIENHWAQTYIDEMQKRGLITTYASDGTPVQYFQPEVWITRAQTASYMTRTFKYIEKILRGY